MIRLTHLTSVALLLGSLALPARETVIADFDGPNYGSWMTEGSAFGNAPAHGKIGGQQAVTGFKGKGLANSFLPDDDSTGSLSSPEFTVAHPFITFLIGGGGWEGETCLNLLIDGEIARTASGPNRASGGTEELRPLAWDVSELIGKTATLQVLDRKKGGWGHINVDHIVATDDRGTIPFAPPPVHEITREITIDSNFLQLPLLDFNDMKAPGNEKLEILDGDGNVLRFKHVHLAHPAEEAEFTYSYDVREFRGKAVTLRYRSFDDSVLSVLQQSDKEIIDPNAYDGPHRPRFHFSPRIGWMNDINGTYYQDGLYHLFYQYNPTSNAWSPGFDMHWGHSVSKDLIHWEEWPITLFPDAVGNIFSGTAVMIHDHISGVNDGASLPTPALFFTGTTPFAQHFATTRDGGKTFQRYSGNPVLNKTLNSDRDPKVAWHKESKHYVMVLYVGEPSHYYIYRSKDLKSWEQTQILPHWYECPEFFQVKSPSTAEDLWLLYGCYQTPEDHPKPFAANSVYQLGKFDGKIFTPVTEIKHAHRGPNFYGALTFANTPNDRKIMMGWTRDIHSPGEPFNQAATLPLHLQLKSINSEDTLTFEPAAEVDALRGEPILSLRNPSGSEAREKLSSLSKEDLLDVVIRFKEPSTQPFEITIRNKVFAYDPATGRINNDRPIHPSGELEARFLIDRSLIESFWNGGEAAYCHGSLHTDDGPAFEISDEAQISEITVYPLKNIWK